MIQISRLSGESIYIPVRIADPVLGAENLVSSTVSVAVVREEPGSSDWESATVQGEWVAPDGDTYWVVRHVLTASAYPEGERQVWVRVVLDGVTYVLRSGPVNFY